MTTRTRRVLDDLLDDSAPDYVAIAIDGPKAVMVALLLAAGGQLIVHDHGIDRTGIGRGHEVRGGDIQPE
jgi:hypothetical protein